MRSIISLCLILTFVFIIASCQNGPEPANPTDVPALPQVAQVAQNITDTRETDTSEDGPGVRPKDVRTPLRMAAPTDIIAYSVQSDGDGQLYELNLTTGVATPIGPTGFSDVEGLSFDPTATTLYAYDDASEQLLTCDTATGACTAVGPSNVGVVDVGLSFDDNGDLWLVTDVPGSLFQIDPATGNATV